jgi:type VI secretion system protein ImpC
VLADGGVLLAAEAGDCSIRSVGSPGWKRLAGRRLAVIQTRKSLTSILRRVKIIDGLNGSSQLAFILESSLETVTIARRILPSFGYSKRDAAYRRQRPKPKAAERTVLSFRPFQKAFCIMAESTSLRVGEIKLTSGTQGNRASVDPETPFRMLVLGNFRGQGRKSGQHPLVQRKPVLVDRDNLAEVLAKLGAEVSMPSGSNPQERITVAVRDLDDLEPDQLFQRLSVFESLRDLRRRLQDPAKFAAAAAEIKGWATAAKIVAPTSPASPSPVAKSISPANLLDQILGESSTARIETVPAAPVASDWDRFVQSVVEPYAVAGTDPRRPEFEALVDEAISAQMRTLLHHPDFQELEAAWRGLLFLVRRVETDANLKLYLLDVAKEELTKDLLGVDDLSQTGVYHHLVERTVGTPGAQPWALVVGAYTFGPGTQDVEILANVAKIASAAGAPVLAAAHSAVLGCPSLVSHCDPRDWQLDPAIQEIWQQLRRLPEAAFLGLVLPRFLLRLAYGKNGTTTEQFAFDEMPRGSTHENYLWGNPALACAVLLGQAFGSSGWNLDLGSRLEIDGLPTPVYEEEDERMTKPCAEVLLNTRAVERILDQGLMPLLSLANSDAMRLARFQSVALPAAPLAGRWL